jgi:hypothetical protein
MHKERSGRPIVCCHRWRCREVSRRDTRSVEGIAILMFDVKGFLTAKAARPDLYRAGSLVIRGLQASLIPWSFRPTTCDESALEVRQQGIYLLPSPMPSTEDDLSASKKRLAALHAMPEEQDKVDTAETTTEEEQGSEEGANDEEEASSSPSEGEEEEEDAQPAPPHGGSGSSAARGAFSLLSIDDSEEEEEEEPEEGSPQ